MEFFNMNTLYLFYLLSCVIFFCEAARISRRDIVFGTPTYSGIKTDRMCNGYTTQACNGILTPQRISRSHVESVSNALSKSPNEYHITTVRERLSRSAESQHTGKLTDDQDIKFEINVVGGKQSKPKEYPHMALIGYGNYSEVNWLCGGTLISNNFVMSAAHCVTSNEGTPTWIRLGELNLATTGEDARVVDVSITQVIVHPDYKSPVQYNDIALFKFKSLDSFSEYIRPICLNIFQDLPNQNVTVAGWGSTGYGEIGSQQLLSVDMDLQKSEQCDSLYRGARLPNGFNASTQICAGYGPGGRDSCQGDSGGPLQIVNYRAGCTTVPIYKQIGIVSFGENCALPDTPGVYTRVSFFIPWIESIVWK